MKTITKYTNEAINEVDIRLHVGYRRLNSMCFESRRLSFMDSLERQYIVRNERIITEEPLYKQILLNYERPNNN